jgi:hypothetical protein
MTRHTPTPEACALSACLDLLAAERVWSIRLNTGSFAFGEGRERRFFRAGVAGMADILAAPVIDGKATLLWIEVKSATGRQRPAQQQFQREVEASGQFYLLARGSDDVLAWLRTHGVKP